MRESGFGVSVAIARRSSAAMLLLLLALSSHAQQAAKSTGATSGSVSGSVSCADTNAPARFAIVTLEPVPGQAHEQEMRAAGGKITVGDKVVATYNATTTTDINGRFVLDKVPAGKYFVIGGLAGYLNPLAEFSTEQLRAMKDETRKELMSQLATVTVDADQTATVSVRLEHASEISGTVLYDDGSPAVTLHVHLLRKQSDGKFVDARTTLAEGTGAFDSDTETDDRGRYRIIGLAPGDYVVEASLPTLSVELGGLLTGETSSVRMGSSRESALAVYTGNSFRMKTAKTVQVENGDAASGEDITIPLNGLHSIRGFAVAMSDGHGLDGGDVELLYADDRERKMSVHFEHNGSFVFANVPEDRYVLRFGGNESYAPIEIPLVVQGEVSGVELAAPDRKKASAAQH